VGVGEVVMWDAVTAISAAVLAIVGVVALFSWKFTLIHTRIDDVVSASRDIIGEINKIISNLERNRMQTALDLYDFLWESWRRFDRVFYVLRRYHKELSPALSGDIAIKLGEPFRATIRSPDPGKAAEIRDEIEVMLKPLYDLEVSRHILLSLGRLWR
jgi:hypothetical protein